MRCARRLSSIVTIFSLLSPAFAHAATKAYITNGFSNTVSVLNLSNNQTVDSINAGGASWDVAINGTGAYITLFNSNIVRVYDTTDNELVTTITVGDGPVYIAFYGTGAYITNSNDNNVSVIDTTNFLVERTIAVGSNPGGIASSGTGMYVANNGTNTVSVIDVTNNLVEQTLTVGSNPYEIAASGTGIYVANQNGSTVSIIDRSNNVVEGSVSVGTNPIAIAISGTGAYVANSGSDNVSIIDISNRLVEKTVTVGGDPGGVAISGTGVYILNRSGNSISVIDTANGLLETTISGFTNPMQMAVASDNATLAPTLTAPASGASIALCDDLTVTYTLPENPTSGSVEIFFYNTSTHTGPTLTMNNSTGASFNLDLENLTASANVVSATGGTSLVAGSYVMYLSYEDAFGNTEEDDTANLTVTDCPASSSSSSSSESSRGGGGGGRPTITPEYILEVAEKRFGSTSSSSKRSEFVEVNGQVFTDVRSGEWYGTFIKKIAELRIFEGYKMLDGTPLNQFGPADPITLGQLAKVGTILWDKKDREPKPTGNEWFKPYIATVQKHELTVFRGSPNALAHATRGHVVQTIMEALNYPLRDGASPYDDVPTDHPYIRAIVTATQMGFIGGDSGTNNFRPDEPINRAEVAKVLSLALGHVGINYLDDLLSATPTSRASASASSSVTISSSSSSASSLTSSTAPSATAGKDIRVVATAILNVRSDARIDSTLLWTARQGQEFEVLRIVAEDWAHVRVSDGGEGYVWVHHLSK